MDINKQMSELKVKAAELSTELGQATLTTFLALWANDAHSEGEYDLMAHALHGAIYRKYLPELLQKSLANLEANNKDKWLSVAVLWLRRGANGEIMKWNEREE